MCGCGVGNLVVGRLASQSSLYVKQGHLVRSVLNSIYVYLLSNIILSKTLLIKLEQHFQSFYGARTLAMVEVQLFGLGCGVAIIERW